MNREVCNHGLLLGSQCDLCMRESREGKPKYVIYEAPAKSAGVDEGMRDDDDDEEDGYPSAADLGSLRDWNVWNDAGHYDRKKLEEWLHFAAGIWCGCGSCSVIGDVGTFATGGWSGNEDIIAAMQKNRAAWLALWESTHRGGKYLFSMRDV